MPDQVDAMIAAWQLKLEELERQAARIKSTINQALDLEGRPPLYTDADLQPSSASHVPVRNDEFFGKPLATAVRMVLDRRHAMKQGAASQDELYSALIAGGFDFEDRSV